MWIGHRERPNEILIQNPALMGAGRPCRGGPARAVTSRASATPSPRTSGPSTRTSRPGGPSDAPAYPTFADGHDEMLVNDAIAESARVGRWVDVVRDPVPSARRQAEARPMKLGLLTAPFPETPLDEVVDWTAANGFESIEIACWPRATGPTRRYAGTVHIDVANLSAGEATEIVEPRSRRRA